MGAARNGQKLDGISVDGISVNAAQDGKIVFGKWDEQPLFGEASSEFVQGNLIRFEQIDDWTGSVVELRIDGNDLRILRLSYYRFSSSISYYPPPSLSPYVSLKLTGPGINATYNFNNANMVVDNTSGGQVGNPGFRYLNAGLSAFDPSSQYTVSIVLKDEFRFRPAQSNIDSYNGSGFYHTGTSNFGQTAGGSLNGNKINACLTPSLPRATGNDPIGFVIGIDNLSIIGGQNTTSRRGVPDYFRIRGPGVDEVLSTTDPTFYRAQDSRQNNDVLVWPNSTTTFIAGQDYFLSYFMRKPVSTIEFTAYEYANDSVGLNFNFPQDLFGVDQYTTFGQMYGPSSLIKFPLPCGDGDVTSCGISLIAIVTDDNRIIVDFQNSGSSDILEQCGYQSILVTNVTQGVSSSVLNLPSGNKDFNNSSLTSPVDGDLIRVQFLT